MKKGFILLVIVAAAALFISGCATTTGSEKTTMPEKTVEPAKITQTGPQSITVGIGPEGYHEVCEDEWKVGDTIKCSFTSTKPLVFNVHYHDANHVKHYNIEDVLVDDFSANFTVQNKNIHCGMWQNNSGSFVKLTYEVEMVKE